MWIDLSTQAVVMQHDEIRAMRPAISAPALLTEEAIEALGFAPVTINPVPEHNPNTHTVVKQGPVPTQEGWQMNWVVSPIDPDVIAANLAAAKIAKNNQINTWRAAANQTSFTHSGKQVACDALSRSDIDAVAGSIALNGTFPTGFPGAWKAMDNSYIILPNTDAFKLLYASMTLQGTVNFGKSQTLKAQLASATTMEQVDAIIWS